MVDPTGDEMRAYLRPLAKQLDASDFDVEEAIYWFANDYHAGQDSYLYCALSTSEFSPGALARAPEPEGAAALLYDELVEEFAAGERPWGAAVVRWVGKPSP